MELNKACTILLLLALVIIVCRISSELGIEGLGHEVSQNDLLDAIDEDATDALEIDWNAVIPASECTYIFGNPPYLKYNKEWNINTCYPSCNMYVYFIEKCFKHLKLN